MHPSCVFSEGLSDGRYPYNIKKAPYSDFSLRRAKENRESVYKRESGIGLTVLLFRTKTVKPKENRTASMHKHYAVRFFFVNNRCRNETLTVSAIYSVLSLPDRDNGVCGNVLDIEHCFVISFSVEIVISRNPCRLIL